MWWIPVFFYFPSNKTRASSLFLLRGTFLLFVKSQVVYWHSKPEFTCNDSNIYEIQNDKRLQLSLEQIRCEATMKKIRLKPENIKITILEIFHNL